MNNVVKPHSFTQFAMEELQSAYLECTQKPVEGRILSAIVSVKQVHDFLIDTDATYAEIDPEELCFAV